MSTPNELQTLFANLKPRQNNSSSSTQTQPGPQNFRSASSTSHIHQPSPQHQAAVNVNTIFNQPTASPRRSPSLKGNSTIASTGMVSPLATGAGSGAASSDRAQSLLSLLKFSHPSNGPGPSLSRTNSDNLAPSQVDTGHAQGRAISASDLVANLMGRSSATPTIKGGGQTPAGQDLSSDNARPATVAGNTAGGHQEALMRLLKRSSESEQSRAAAGETASKATVDMSAGNTASPIRMFGSAQSREATPFEPTVPEQTPVPEAESKGIFTYKNPFETLAAASRQHTPQPAAGENETNAAQASSRKTLAPQSKMRKTSNGPTNIMETPTPADIVPSIEENATENNTDIATSIEVDQMSQEIKKEDEQIEALAEQLEDTAIEAAKDVKHELEKPENAGILEEELPKPVAEAVREVINEAVEENPDKWESMESAENSTVVPEKVVPVYNFPIKPFVSILVQDVKPAVGGFSAHDHVPIAKFHKEFDQLDRTLASASNKFIAYCHAKNGGLRVIRQDDGADRRLFMSAKDRMFSVSFCTTAANDPTTEVQALIASGVNGATYYATLSTDGHSYFDADLLESESLVFPPFPKGDENTSGGMLKTRARRSSRHPDFFAIGRGKAIHLIWPSTAMSSKYGVSGSHREVNVEKFYSERSLKITTGKAGKDFTFSEDDTLIVSLDKVGRLRFWDIRQLVNDTNATATRMTPIDVRIPLLTLSTATASEKIWPTSVLFVDKLRPYVKNCALRYVLVGLKQNHTLQLWDILLGKAVQEINFPHQTETDAICSVAYHPSSGIIVVGHPTRNSIYFVHLSAPKYNLPAMSQAEYVQRIVTKQSDLPTPDSTACMSGVREISFEEMGQLRCLDLMPVFSDGSSPRTDDEATRPLFELYITHAKGVLCRSVSKKELGWNAKSKVIHPVDALEAGVITIKALKLGTIVSEPPEVNGESQELPPTTTSAKPSKKKSKQTREEPQQPEAVRSTLDPQPLTSRQRSRSPATAQPSELSAADRETSKKKRNKAQPSPKPKPSSASQIALSAPEPTEDMSGASNQNPVQPAVPQLATPSKSPAKPPTENVSIGISGDWLDKEMKKIEAMFKSVLDGQMQNLYHHTRQDRIIQDESAQARQDAMLRVISTTLTQNVEQSLSRMITGAIQNSVLPGVANLVSGNLGPRLGEQLSSQIGSQLHSIVPHQVTQNLSTAIAAAVQSPAVTHHITQAISDRVAHKFENDFTEFFHNTITPTFRDLSLRAAEQNALEAERRVAELLKTYEVERRADQNKVDKILETMQALTESVTLMSSSQVEFQRQILKDRATKTAQLSDGENSNGDRTSREYSRPISSLQAVPATPTQPQQEHRVSQATPTHQQDPEISAITMLMQEGKYEDACIRWLQSSHQDDVFDNLFAHIKPDFITGQVSPLVSFSIAVTVASSFATNPATRLEWLNTMLGVFDISDTEINELSSHAPALMDSIVSKLENLYTQYVNTSPNDPVVRMIPPIMHRAREVRSAMAGSMGGGSRSQSRHVSGHGHAHYR